MKRSFRPKAFPAAYSFIYNRGHRMSLPDAPIAHEGLFVVHYFTVSEQDKSKDLHGGILGGKVIKPDNPCYIKFDPPQLNVPCAR